MPPSKGTGQGGNMPPQGLLGVPIPIPAAFEVDTINGDRMKKITMGAILKIFLYMVVYFFNSKNKATKL
jgi:hypothetical protein